MIFPLTRSNFSTAAAAPSRGPSNAKSAERLRRVKKAKPAHARALPAPLPCRAMARVEAPGGFVAIAGGPQQVVAGSVLLGELLF